MGIMTAGGLAGLISKAFISFSTANTQPLSTYLSSLVDTGPCKVLSCCPQPKL
jgi:short subunit fatty acids transporter